jgi:glycogen operon protein
MFFRHDGEAMTDEDWSNPLTSSLAVFYAGEAVGAFDDEGAPQLDDDLLIVMNGSGVDLDFTVPQLRKNASGDPDRTWMLVVDTGDDGACEEVAPGQTTRVGQRSLKLFHRPRMGAAPVM